MCDKRATSRAISRSLFVSLSELSGFRAAFGDMPLWHSLASYVILPYISSYPCVTTLILWGHGRSVAPETASMEEGASFRLDTSHDCFYPFVTRCDHATPRRVRGR